MRTHLVSFFAILATSACARGPNVTSEQLPLRRVVVYRNGVGYYERAGHVESTEVRFRMRQKLIGDFLATMAIVERGGSSVRSASFPIELEEAADLRSQELQELWRPDFNGKSKEKNPLKNVVLRLDGAKHDLAVGYVAETPVWQPSYRVVLDKTGKAELQSWGIIENLSGENWQDVELVLIAGAPLAFQSNLGQPITPPRPLVSDSGEVIAAMPEGVTSVATNAAGPVDRYEPEAQPAPSQPQEAEEAADKDEDLRADSKTMAASRARRSAGAGMKAGGAPAPAAMVAGHLAPSPPPVSMMKMSAPSKPRNMSVLAAVAVQSGATRYAIPYRVTVPNESATMVLLLQRDVPGESVFLFAPDGGVSDSATHPFRVARFTNATDGLLERGPIAVFEKGSFLGQGLLDSLPAGATATVPFALERSIGVQSETNVDERGARLTHVESGNLTIERDTVVRTTYKIQNGAADAAKMLVRHGRRPGTRLYHPPAGTEDNTASGTALVPMDVRGNARAELIIDERAATQQFVDWLSVLADEAVEAFIKDDRADKGQRDALAAAWQIRQAWKALADEQSTLNAERDELSRTQAELRANLEAIRKNEQAADLRKKLTKKLDESTTRFDKVQKRLVELSVATREQQIRFRDAVRDIKITIAPPVKD